MDRLQICHLFPRVLQNGVVPYYSKALPER